MSMTKITESPLFAALTSALGPDYHIGADDMGGVTLCDKLGNAIATMSTQKYAWSDSEVASVEFLPPSCTIMPTSDDARLRLAQGRTWRDQFVAQLRYRPFQNFDCDDVRSVFDALNAHSRYHHGTRSFPFPPAESAEKDGTAQFMMAAPGLSDDSLVFDRAPYEATVEAIENALADDFALIAIRGGWAIAADKFHYGELRPTEGNDENGALMFALFSEPRDVDRALHCVSPSCPRMIIEALSGVAASVAVKRLAEWTRSQTSLLPGQRCPFA